MTLRNSQERGRGRREKGSVYRTLAVALAPVGVVVFLGAGTAAAQTTTAPNCSTVGYDGSGTTTDPFEVTNVSQLQCMGNASTSTSLDDSFEQVSDINASGTSSWNGGAGFDPVGSPSDPFTGSFDGAGNTVNDLTIDRPSTNDVGIFSTVGARGTVADTTLGSVNVTGQRKVGGLAGNLTDDGTVTGSSVRGNVTSTESFGFHFAGRLVGVSAGTVTDSSANVSVRGESGGSGRIGGLVGQNGDFSGNAGTVRDSSASGTVTGVAFALRIGGLVGNNLAGEIINSSADAEVVGEAGPEGTLPQRLGGLVGENLATVKQSSASGSVSGGFNVGGFAGIDEGGTIERSFATGNVDSEFGGAGGLVGLSDGFGVSESFATGDVVSGGGAGGLVGINAAPLNDSYAKGSVDGDTAGGVVGFNSGTVDETYAAGRVSTGVEGVAGGIVGQNGEDAISGFRNGSDGVLRSSYWDVTDSGTAQTVPIGKEGGDDTTNFEGGDSIVEGDVRGLITARMQGEAADTTDNMTAFDFENTWVTVTGDEEIVTVFGSIQLAQEGEDYPVLGWQVETASGPGSGVGGCIDRRDLGRGQEELECPKDRVIERGGSREELDRETGRSSDTSRRDRSRRSRGR